MIRGPEHFHNETKFRKRLVFDDFASKVRRMFRNGLDTQSIAHILDREEWEIYNALARTRA